MITYLSLLISGLLGFLGLFLNSAKEKGAKGNNFKRLTSAGWIVFVFMALSLILSFVAQRVNEASAKAQLELKSKNDLLIFNKMQNEEKIAKQQSSNLQKLLGESHKIDSIQTVALKNGGDFNSYLQSQLQNQKIQINRQQELFGKLAVLYVFKIPSSEQYVNSYKQRVVDSHGYNLENFLDSSILAPNRYYESQLYIFTHQFFFSTIFLFNKVQTFNQAESRPAPMSMFYSETIQQSSSAHNKLENIPNFSLFYSNLDSSFTLSVETYPTWQHHNESMISLADFADKYCYFNTGSQDAIKYELKFIRLISENGLILDIKNFKKLGDNFFYAKIPKNAVFK